MATAAGAAAAAGVSDEDVICISDSQPSDSDAGEAAAHDVSMDVDAGDSAADQEQDFAQLPKRSIKPPERFTPAKHPPGKRRGRYANAPSSNSYKKSYLQPTSTAQKKPGSAMRGRPAAFTPLSVTPAPATPAATAAAIAAAAAGDADSPAAAEGVPDAVAVAALGLQVAEQYSQLLAQVKALLDSLDPSQVRHLQEP